MTESRIERMKLYVTRAIAEERLQRLKNIEAAREEADCFNDSNIFDEFYEGCAD